MQDEAADAKSKIHAYLGAAAKALAEQGTPKRRRKSPRPRMTAADVERLGAPINLTDLGNARRLVAEHRADIRYCHPMKKWWHYDGKRWVMDDTGDIQRRAKATIGKMYHDAAEMDSAARAALAEHAVESEAKPRIEAMVKLAESEPGIPVLSDDFDRDTMLLNVATGTIDLRTGELRAASRDDMITKLADVEYEAEPGIDCSLWLAMLGRIMADRAGLIEFLRRLLGYCLTGHVSEHVLPIWHGVGANGKTTLLNAMLEIMGDYAMEAPPDLLTAKKGAHPTERADLFGRRLVSANETEEGQQVAEALAKALTGANRIRARRMNENFWEFAPTHKIILATNHRPHVRGTDYAIWRRIKLVPFDVVIPDAEQNKQLPEKLKAEYPGILRWLVGSCLAWQRDGLGIPAEVEAATKKYRHDEDVFAQFVEACCVVDRHARATATKLLEAYRAYTGDETVNSTAFAALLKERGFANEMITAGPQKGRKRWLGIGLRDDDQQDGRE